MTAPTSVVTVEHDGNVTFVSWHPVEPPRPPMLPKPLVVGVRARTPTARSYLARCWHRSQLRRDLADAGVVIGIAVAVLICVAIWPDEITRAANVLLGGAK